MQNPFIPKKRANLAVISGQASDEIVYNLISKGLEVVKTIKVESISPEIAYHPDLILHPVALNTLVVAPEVFYYYSEKLGPYGLKVIKGKSSLERDYPGDISYNILRIGDHFVHKNGCSDEIIMEHYSEIDLNFIPVAQGYTKCSTALVDDQSAITSDKKIEEKLTSAGYEVLLIEKGWIDLPGYEHGFIGGSSGHISLKEIVFTGSLRSHPDRAKIEAFIGNRGIEIIYLSKEKIVDLGTVFCFKYD